MRLHKSDLEDDIASYIFERMPLYDMKTLIDCGANVGWFTYQFLKKYPKLKSYCIEPVPSIAKELINNLSRFTDLRSCDRVKVYQKAMSNKSGFSFMTEEPGVTVNKISPFGSLKVEVITGDEFCFNQSISNINFLKIDCEGFDDKVLMGFEHTIDNGKIDFIQVEAAVGENNSNGMHVSSSFFEQYLIPKGFRHFRFTNQASSDSSAFLSRFDMIFIRHQLAVNYFFQ
jgi:FkbM family methyltransferase